MFFVGPLAFGADNGHPVFCYLPCSRGPALGRGLAEKIWPELALGNSSGRIPELPGGWRGSDAGLLCFGGFVYCERHFATFGSRKSNLHTACRIAMALWQFLICFMARSRQGWVHQLSLFQGILRLPWFNWRTQPVQFNKQEITIWPMLLFWSAI